MIENTNQIKKQKLTAESSQSLQKTAEKDSSSQISAHKAAQICRMKNEIEGIRSQIGELPKFVKLDIGGKEFFVCATLLKNFPESLLSTLVYENLLMPMDKKSLESVPALYLDRKSSLFEYIIDYYRTKKIFLPKSIPREVIEEELEYFNLPIKSSEIVKESDVWVKIVKTVKKNVKNEALRSILANLAFQKDERLKFFYNIEEKSKGKTACLDAARINCPYCNKEVYFYFSDSYCTKKRHRGIWSKSDSAWSCCGVKDITLEGCVYELHSDCLGFNKEWE